MSRVQFLARKPLPILNIGQGDTPVGASAGGALTTNAIVIAPGTSNDIWEIQPVQGTRGENDTPLFVLQHVATKLWASAPLVPQPGSVIAADPAAVTLWGIKFIDNGGHAIYPAAAPDLFWSLDGIEHGTQVVLQSDTTNPNTLWRFDL